MIKSVRIKNIALIETAEIEFFGGFNVLSGETGSGKTVIINAINFALGAKADKTLIRYGENYCETEVVFSEIPSTAKSVLEDLSIDVDDEIVVRRKLTIEGRSDIRVNGVSVTLSMLKKLTLSLCDIYGQSEHYSLLNQANQLKVLDLYVGEPIEILKEKAQPYIEDIKKSRKILEENGGDDRTRAVRMDILSYQINEIEKAELVDGEEDELLSKQQIFKNAQKIGESLSVVDGGLSGDGGACDIISTVLSKLQQISNYSSDYEELYDRLYSLKVEADDISSTASDLLSNIDFDERERQRVEDRLDLLKSLKRKYGSTYSEIMEFYSKSLEEYDNLQNFEHLSKECEDKILNAKKQLEYIYNEMFDLRVEFAKKFSSAVEEELSTLGMSGARFEVSVTKTDKDLSLDGNSLVEFTFSANKGEPLKNMSKIISGGEMSRFMLALKIVSSDIGGTYIFDEIDAGISGDVAKIVAKKFVKLSKKSQIITISHLPQILSFADENYLIKKSDVSGKTITTVSWLDFDGKVNEIVRLTGGGDLEVAKLNAISSINSANQFKKSI